MRRAGVLIALVALAGCGGGGAATQASHAGRTQVVAGPLQVSNGPAQAADPGARPLALALSGASDRVRVTFKRPPRSGLLFDLDTGQVLWRRQADRVLPIASPTKRIKLETMLNGLLLPSGNDAAIALAQRMSGTVAAFVTRMNERAGDLGLTCTRFSSPDGFEDAGNHSCAIDLAEMARAVLDRPRLARIVRRRRAVLPFPIKGGRIYLFNNNPLLRTGYPGTIGIKTGYTDAAGRCLVAAARRNGRRLGVVLLHSPDPGKQATQLLNRGFAAQR